MCAISGPPEYCYTTLMQPAAVLPASFVLIHDGANRAREDVVASGEPGQSVRRVRFLQRGYLLGR
jgi:hypothetical protein